MGMRLSPTSESAYSVRMGVSGITVRVMRPAASISLRLEERTFWLMPAMEERRDFSKFKKCAKCELFGWCRGCPAVTSGYTGDMYDADPQCWKVVE